MKKILLLVLVLVFLVGCNQSSLGKKLEGEWLLLERHMVIEFNTEENNYIEFKDTFDLESQVQSRYIRYNKDDEFALDSERANITSFYTQTFGEDFCDVENYVKTENSYYTITYGKDEVFYKLDQDRSSADEAEVYELNGFSNQVTFVDGKIQLQMLLTAEDFTGDDSYDTVKSINSTMTLEPYTEE